MSAVLNERLLEYATLIGRGLFLGCVSICIAALSALLLLGVQWLLH